MRVPKGRPVHENLNTSYVNVGALLADLQVNGFTGYVQVTMGAYEAYVFVDVGTIIGAIEQKEAASRSGSEAINGLLLRSEKPGGMVSIYNHPSATTQAIAGIIDSQVVHQGLSSDFTDLDKLIKKLRRDKEALWYVEVAVAGDQGVGVIFINDGEPDGVFTPAAGDTLSGADALTAMIESSDALGAFFNVYTVPAAAPAPAEPGPRLKVVPPSPETAAAAPPPPPPASPAPPPEPAIPDAADDENLPVTAIDDEVAPLVLLMSDVVSTIERTVTARDGAGSFAIELRAGQLEVAENYPFLDPFAAEFEYHAGEIAFVGAVDPEEFAVGLGEALHVTVAALARRDGPEGEKLRRRIAESLAELYEARHDEFDAFGLAGLLTYIAEPEASREADAGVGETV